MNEAGLVVGYGRRADNTERAFAWKSGQASLREMDLLPARGRPRLRGQRGRLVVVGVARSKHGTAGLVLRALVELTSVTDLGTLPGGSNSVALGIDGFGQIVGEATDAATASVPGCIPPAETSTSTT